MWYAIQELKSTCHHWVILVLHPWIFTAFSGVWNRMKAPKEVWKSNFWPYGHMRSRAGCESEKRRKEKKKQDQGRESLKKEDPGARKSGKVGKRYSLKHGCGAIWPDEKLKVAGHCGAKQISKSKWTKHILATLLEVETSKSARRSGAKHMSKSKVKKMDGFVTLFEVQMAFWSAGATDSVLCQKWAKRAGLEEVSTTTAAMLHCTTRHDTIRHDTTLHYRLHPSSLHYTPTTTTTTLHDTTLHSTPLH